MRVRSLVGLGGFVDVALFRIMVDCLVLGVTVFYRILWIFCADISSALPAMSCVCTRISSSAVAASVSAVGVVARVGHSNALCMIIVAVEWS